MLMSLLKKSTIALAIATMFTNLTISPHPKLLSSFLILLFLHWFVMQWYHHSVMTNITAN